jgi:hypothetical protein
MTLAGVDSDETNNNERAVSMFTITMRMGNEAFTDYPGEELARILRGLADHVEGQTAQRPPGAKRAGRLRDINGNTVGTWKWSGKATLTDGAS